MGPEALHGIQRTLRAPGGYGSMLLIFGVCSLLMLAVLLHIYVLPVDAGAGGWRSAGASSPRAWCATA